MNYESQKIARTRSDILTAALPLSHSLLVVPKFLSPTSRILFQSWQVVICSRRFTVVPDRWSVITTVREGGTRRMNVLVGIYWRYYYGPRRKELNLALSMKKETRELG